MHIHNNSVLHYLYNMTIWRCYLFQGQSIQGQGQDQRIPRTKPRNLAWRQRPTPRINISGVTYFIM